MLDALLLRLHTKTACRRGGALSICLVDLDPDRCLVQQREKGSTPLATHHPALANACSTTPPPAALACLPMPYFRSAMAAATSTYIKTNLQEVATALATLTGQQHPLALPAPDIDDRRINRPSDTPPTTALGVAHLTKQNMRLLPWGS